MKVVLFGNSRFASLAWYCLSQDSGDEVVGFTVDAEYLGGNRLHGLPVVDFATVEREFPPASHQMLLPVGPNDLRRERSHQARDKGFTLARYLSSRALLWPDLEVGANCLIFDGAVVQPFAQIGDNTIIRHGALVSHHVSVGEHCFLAAGACLGGGVTLGANCFVGLNATICEGITVGAGCFIAAGAVLTVDAAPEGLYRGNPARRVKQATVEASGRGIDHLLT